MDNIKQLSFNVPQGIPFRSVPRMAWKPWKLVFRKVVFISGTRYHWNI